MLGAVVGDIIGSPYEFVNMYSRRGVKPFERTIRGRCQFTDDIVLSMAVADVLLSACDLTDDQLLGNKIAENLVKYYKRYPLKKWGRNLCYGSGFAKWADKGDIHGRRIQMEVQCGLYPLDGCIRPWKKLSALPE